MKMPKSLSNKDFLIHCKTQERHNTVCNLIGSYNIYIIKNNNLSYGKCNRLTTVYTISNNKMTFIWLTKTINKRCAQENK